MTQPTENNLHKIITDTVNHLRVDHNERVMDLAEVFGVTASYLSKKCGSHRWSLEDLDILADHYRHDPADILHGYGHLRTMTPTDTRHPETMRNRLSHTVRHLMLDHNEHFEDVAPVFGMTPRGFGLKVTGTRWTIANIVTLANRYGVQPHDFAAGYDHLVRIGTQIAA